MEIPTEDLGTFDIARLRKPETDAYRHIASALGATFAGDDAEPATDAPVLTRDRGEVAHFPRAGSAHVITTADPKRARLLDRVPIPLVVADGDSIAFINRAALGMLGYGSAAILDAAGGLGALFGTQSGRDGLVAVRTGAGRSFPARVEMAPIEWGFGHALLLSIMPVEKAEAEATGAPQRTALDAADPLSALLDAIPTPLAIVNRSGDVEACNGAFVALGPNDRSTARLDERLNAADLRHLLHTVESSFCAADGMADTVWPLIASGSPYWVSAGALAGGPLACISFQRYSPAFEEPRPVTGRLVALAEAAAGEVRRLIGEASVMLIHRRSSPPAPLCESDAFAIQCLRAVLLGAAGRSTVGGVLTLESSLDEITLSLHPAHSSTPFDGVVSDRVRAMAAESGLALAVYGNRIAIMEAEEAASLRSA